MATEVGLGSIQRLAAAAAVVAALSAPSVADAQPAQSAGVGAWSLAGSMFERHYEEKPALLSDGRVLVVGETGAQTTTAEIYDPSSGTWSAAGGIGSQASGWTVVALADGGAMAIGASTCRETWRSPCNPASLAYRLDPGAARWIASAPMPQATARPVAVRLASGRVLVAGGFGEPCTGFIRGYTCPATAGAEMYDPSTDRWSAIAPMPSPRAGAGGALMSDGTVLLVGGSERTRDVLRYNPATATWTTLGPTAFAHTGPSLIALPGDRAIALGEQAGADFFRVGGEQSELKAPLARESCQSTPEIFTVATDSWSPVPPFPEGTFACSTSGALLNDGQLLYETYVLDRSRRCWSLAAPRPARLGGLLMPLPGGKALGFGETEEPVSASAIYTPTPSRCGSSVRLQASISGQLVPTGPATSFSVAVEDGYPLSLRLPSRGVIEVRWFQRPIRYRRERPRGPTLIASGRTHSDRAGQFALRIRLTSAGEPIVGSPGSLVVNARARYIPDGGKPVSSARSFVLSREGTRAGPPGR
jgi:hypothetical protein